MNESKRPIDGLTYTRAEWEAVKHKDALHQKGIFCPLMEKGLPESGSGQR